MINIETHKIIDMICSREIDDVAAWLKTYPNLLIVSRDGSQTYRYAIYLAHPNAVQISDRFHLLKNLTSYASDYLKKNLKSQVSISVPESDTVKINISKAQENRKLTLKEKYDQIDGLLRSGYNKSNICKELNLDIRVYNKLCSMTGEQREKYFTTKLTSKHDEKLSNKMTIVQEVRELKKIGYSLCDISQKTGLDTRTIKRYCQEDYNPIHASYGVKRAGLLTAFYTTINLMIEQGLKGSVIEKTIRENGYKGSSSTVSHYISEWKRRKISVAETSENINNKQQILIERKNLLKLLYHPIEKVKEITNEHFLKVCCEYDCFKIIHSLVWGFKNILLGDNVDELDNWIIKANEVNIPEINSFINGIKRDFDAVKNAILYKQNNGLAEGKVNKLKVMKRIMYGRCHFETLKMKVLKMEKWYKFN